MTSDSRSFLFRSLVTSTATSLFHSRFTTSCCSLKQRSLLAFELENMPSTYSESDSSSIGISASFRRFLQEAPFGLQIQLAQPETLSVQEKAGIGVGVILVVLLVLVGFLCWRRRRSARIRIRKSVDASRVERIDGSRRGYYTDADSSMSGFSAMEYSDIESPRSSREFADEAFDSTMVHA
jgi:hypothetical protein